MYQIVFDDRSAPTTISEIVFSQARQSYLALSSDEQQTGVHVEPPARQKKVQNRRKNNRDQQQPPITTTSSNAADNGNNSTAGALPIGTSASTSSTVTNTSTLPAAVVPTSTIANQSTTVSNISPLLCSIQECPEYCDPTTIRACTECPESERCYMYCHLHNKHISHANQSAPRRINSTTTAPIPTNNNTGSRFNNDNIATSSSNDVHTVNNDDNIQTSSSSTTATTILLNARGGPARKKKKFNPDSEELCWCGCNISYDNSCMSQCKGLDCDKLVNRTCVPSTWLCNSCKPRDSSKS